MAVLGAEWYTTNAQRKFPIDDAATCIDDGGGRLPSNLLVDANIRFPSTLGSILYISSAAVTANLVTLTFLADVGGPADFTPVAAISLAISELEEDRVYPIEALYPGVGGWVVFGEAIRSQYQGVFSSSAQSFLAPKAARSYEPFPVSSIGKVTRASTLSGLVALLAGNDMKVVRGFRNIAGVERECMIFSLEGPNGDDVGPLSTYLGTCDGRPESDSCRESAVQFLGEATPDCNGNIDVVFVGDLAIGTLEEEVGGMVVDFPLGQVDACTNRNTLPNAEGVLPSEHPTQCNYGPAYTLPSLNQAIGPAPVLSEEYVTAPTVTQTQNLTPGTIASAESFGSPTVVIDQSVSPDTVASAENFGSPTLTILQTLLPDTIGSAEVVSDNLIVSQPQTIEPDEIPSEEFFESDTFVEPAPQQDIFPDEINSEELFEDPEVTGGD